MCTLAEAFTSMDMPVHPLDGGWSTDVVFSEEFPAFQGHFPGHPILPAVVQISLGLHVLSLGAQKNVILQNIVQSKFMAQIEPNQPLSVQVSPYGETEDAMAQIWTIQIRRVDNETQQNVAQCRVHVGWK